MKKRLGWASLALGIVTTAACGGDDPKGSVDPENDGPSATPDGGEAGTPPATLQPRVEIKVDPVVVVRGQTVRIPVQVFRVDTASAITIELQNAPAGTVPSAPLTLAANLPGGELSLATVEAAAYGDYALQITATAPDLPAPVTFQVPLQVRGVPGALDTSFGDGGRAPVLPNGSIGDVMVDAQGRYVIAGGYNAPTDNMLFARLTPDGQTDATFGASGLLRFPAAYGHIGHFEMRPGYYRRGLQETGAGYSLSAFVEPNTGVPSSVMVHSETTLEGAAPTTLPATAPAVDLGSPNGGSRVLRDGDGFIRFLFGCAIERRLADNTVDPTFGVAGKVSLGAAGCSVADYMATDDNLYVVTATGAAADDPRNVVVLSRKGAVLLTAAAEPVPMFFSRPNAAGSVLVTHGTAVHELSFASGAITDTVLEGTRFDPSLGPASAKGSLAVYLPDGNLGLVAFAAQPVFHRLSPSGESLGASTGVTLEDASFTQFKAVSEAFADARGHLVLVYVESASEPLYEHWTIKRFWL